MNPAPWRIPLLAGLIIAIALGSIALRAERADLAYRCAIVQDGRVVAQYRATTGAPPPVEGCATARANALAAHDTRTWLYRAAALAVFLATFGATTAPSRRTIRRNADRLASLIGHPPGRAPS